jgi:hypothetical protein
MREVVKGLNDLEQTIFIAIAFSNQMPFTTHNLYVFNGKKVEDKLAYSTFIDALLGEWQYGEEIEFIEPHEKHIWQIQEAAPFAKYIAREKYDMLVKKAQQAHYVYQSNLYYEELAQKIEAIQPSILALTAYEKECNKPLVEIDAEIKKLATTFKQNKQEQQITDAFLTHADMVKLQQMLQPLFNYIHSIRDKASEENYNNLYSKIEQCYLLSKIATAWKETREGLIAVQQLLNTSQLDRMQRAELNARLQSAFNILSQRQTEDKQTFLTHSNAQFELLQQTLNQYINDIDAAEHYDIMFNKLIVLQNNIKEHRLKKEHKDLLFDTLNKAFTALKERNKMLTAHHYDEATESISKAIQTAESEENFKEARVILVDAQQALKNYKLSKTQKDVLFENIRQAFETLNSKQDLFFKTRNQQRQHQVENTLQHLKRILYKKKEGIEKLYEVKTGLQYKITLIKPGKQSNELVTSFEERITQLTEKINAAEQDINDLNSKIEKMETNA